MTYSKEIWIYYNVNKDISKVTKSDFPSSVDYSEPPPYANCDSARDTLYLYSYMHNKLCCHIPFSSFCALYIEYLSSRALINRPIEMITPP